MPSNTPETTGIQNCPLQQIVGGETGGEKLAVTALQSHRTVGWRLEPRPLLLTHSPPTSIVEMSGMCI